MIYDNCGCTVKIGLTQVSVMYMYRTICFLDNCVCKDEIGLTLTQIFDLISVMYRYTAIWYMTSAVVQTRSE